MSITLITGVPGSGKTLYAVTEMLKPLIGTEVTRIDDDGVKHPIRRVLYSNINGLLLEHELIIGNGEWKRNPGKPVDDQWSFEGENKYGLHNWHEWAKPGSVICFDEFQKAWPPRPNGAPIPPDIQALDTHRHMGVDFILPTQKCNNFDRHILGLVDRHLHVRRVAGMALAVVYEWDHASPSLLYKNAMTKGAWRFKKWGYQLYKSAEVHTAMKRKMPALVWFILLGLLGAAFAIPKFVGRLDERMTPKTQGQLFGKNNEKLKPVQTVQDGLLVTTSVETSDFVPPAAIPSLAASAPENAPASPVIAGCFQVRTVCGCVDSVGQPIETKADVCESRIRGMSPPGQKAEVVDLAQVYASRAKTDDVEVYSWLKNQRRPSF